MANRAVPIESSAAPVSPAWFTKASRRVPLPMPTGSRSREREKAAAQPQLKGEGSEAGPSPLSSEPFALLAPLGEDLLVLTFPFLLFLKGPFAGVIHQSICCSLAIWRSCSDWPKKLPCPPS